MGSHRVRHESSDLAAAAAMVKNLPANVGDARDAGLIPESGRSPGVGKDNLILSGKCHRQKRLLGFSPWGSQRVRHD